MAPATTHALILTWADQQARAQRTSLYGRLMWFANVFDWQTDRQRDLEAQGFFSVADWGEDSWTKVLLHHDQGQLPHTAESLPAGYTLRPLRGADEVEAYVALHRAVFESESMTAAWRQRTLQHPDYQADLDLVIVDFTGQLAAFCIGWFTTSGIEGRPSGQIEPLGVLADRRHLGLGRAILREGVRRCYSAPK